MESRPRHIGSGSLMRAKCHPPGHLKRMGIAQVAVSFGDKKPPSLCPSQPAMTLKSIPASIAFEQK